MPQPSPYLDAVDDYASVLVCQQFPEPTEQDASEHVDPAVVSDWFTRELSVASPLSILSEAFCENLTDAEAIDILQGRIDATQIMTRTLHKHVVHFLMRDAELRSDEMREGGSEDPFDDPVRKDLSALAAEINGQLRAGWNR